MAGRLSRAAGATGSILLHLALILSLLAATGRIKAPPGHLSPAEIRVLEETHKLRGKEPPMMTVPIKAIDINGLAGAIAPPCLYGSYHGIGVSGWWHVRDVGANTPAERAGIQVGDELVNEEILGPNRYPDGTRLHLIVRRDERQFEVDVVTAEICEDK